MGHLQFSEEQPRIAPWLHHSAAVRSWANDFLTQPGFSHLYKGSFWAPFQVRTGLLMNLMGVLLLSLAMNTWAQTVFQLGTFPDWANIHSANITAPLSALANNTSRTL